MDDGGGLADVGEELVPQALALGGPFTRPAMSTNSTTRASFSSGGTLGELVQRWSGTATTPTLGSMVQKG
jgi:hypothetical protein